PPRPAPFPYTTLFRSRARPPASRLQHDVSEENTMDHDDGAVPRVTRRDTLKILGGTAAGMLASGVVGCAPGGARPAPGAAPSGAPTTPPAPAKVRIGVTQGLS